MDKNKRKSKRQDLEQKNQENGHFGVDAETSLQSVNFATTENPYLNEHFQEEADN